MKEPTPTERVNHNAGSFRQVAHDLATELEQAQEEIGKWKELTGWSNPDVAYACRCGLVNDVSIATNALSACRGQLEQAQRQNSALLKQQTHEEQTRADMKSAEVCLRYELETAQRQLKVVTTERDELMRTSQKKSKHISSLKATLKKENLE